MIARQTAKLLAGLTLAGTLATPVFAADVTAEAVVKTYADLALAKYGDALTTARALDAATDALIANPSPETLRAARGRMARRAGALPAIGGLPFWQRHRRRLGRPREFLAAR